MTKHKLAAAVAARTGLPYSRALEAVQVVFESVAQGLIEKGSVTIVGFGRFQRRCASSTHCRMNFKTGQRMTGPAPVRYRVAFRPAANFKQALNTGQSFST